MKKIQEIQAELRSQIENLNRWIYPEGCKQHTKWTQTKHLNGYINDHWKSHERIIKDWYENMEENIIPAMHKTVRKKSGSVLSRWISHDDVYHRYLPETTTPEMFMNREVCRRLLRWYKCSDGELIEDTWSEISTEELQEVITWVRIGGKPPRWLVSAGEHLHKNQQKITKRDYYQELLDDLQGLIDRYEVMQVVQPACYKEGCQTVVYNFSERESQLLLDVKFALGEVA